MDTPSPQAVEAAKETIQRYLAADGCPSDHGYALPVQSAVAEAVRELDNRDGNWCDKWGSCKVCGGEIPHGHTDKCDVFKLEQQAKQLTAERDEARGHVVDWREVDRQNKQLIEERDEANKYVDENYQIILALRKQITGAEVERDALRDAVRAKDEALREAIAETEWRQQWINAQLPNEGGWENECPFCHVTVEHGQLHHSTRCVVLTPVFLPKARAVLSQPQTGKEGDSQCRQTQSGKDFPDSQTSVSPAVPESNPQDTAKSETPRTDAEEYLGVAYPYFRGDDPRNQQQLVVRAFIARTLERELREARETCGSAILAQHEAVEQMERADAHSRHMTELRELAHKGRDEALAELAAAKVERDEANERIEYQSNLIANIQDTCRSRGFTDNVLDERVIAMAQALDKAIKERDAAKAELEKARAQHQERVAYLFSDISTLRAQVEPLIKERDALRLAFSEASHNAGPAFVAHEDLRIARAQVEQLRTALKGTRHWMGHASNSDQAAIFVQKIEAIDAALAATAPKGEARS